MSLEIQFTGGESQAYMLIGNPYTKKKARSLFNNKDGKEL